MDNLWRDGRLMHSSRGGRANVDGLLEDYASLANALVTLYEAHFEEHWINEAVRLADEILHRFTDQEEGGFYINAKEQHSVIVRKKDILDGSVPSSGGLATTALLRLGKLCRRDDYLQAAEAGLRNAAPLMEQAPGGTAQMLLGLDLYLGPTPELVIYGSTDPGSTEVVLGELHRRYMPNKMVVFRDPTAANTRSQALQPAFQGKEPSMPGPTLYVCDHSSCQPPVIGKEATLATLAVLGLKS